jgi:hypothetical protein
MAVPDGVIAPRGLQEIRRSGGGLQEIREVRRRQEIRSSGDDSNPELLRKYGFAYSIWWSPATAAALFVVRGVA